MQTYDFGGVLFYDRRGDGRYQSSIKGYPYLSLESEDGWWSATAVFGIGNSVRFSKDSTEDRAVRMALSALRTHARYPLCRELLESLGVVDAPEAPPAPPVEPPEPEAPRPIYDDPRPTEGCATCNGSDMCVSWYSDDTNRCGACGSVWTPKCVEAVRAEIMQTAIDTVRAATDKLVQETAPAADDGFVITYRAPGSVISPFGTELHENFTQATAAVMLQEMADLGLECEDEVDPAPASITINADIAPFASWRDVKVSIGGLVMEPCEVDLECDE